MDVDVRPLHLANLWNQPVKKWYVRLFLYDLQPPRRHNHLSSLTRWTTRQTRFLRQVLTPVPNPDSPNLVE